MTFLLLQKGVFQINTATVFNLNNNSIRLQSKNSRELQARLILRHGFARRTKDDFYLKFRCTSFLTYREQLWNWHLEQHVFNQRKYLLIASNNHNLGRFESLVSFKKRQNKTTKSRPKNNILNWWQTGRNWKKVFLRIKRVFLHYFCCNNHQLESKEIIYLMISQLFSIIILLKISSL